MHRSGTSAVAGYLAKAGFFAGHEADLLAPAEDNPKGFFEREDVNELNDSVLADLGGSWDNPPPRDVVAAKAAAYAPEVAALLGRLDEQSEGRPLVVKDPRVSLLLPAWLPALKDQFAIVVVDRPPLEVALSVRKRDHRPLAVALALWQLYCTELAHGLEGRQALVVRYQDFVANGAERGPWLLHQVAQGLPDLVPEVSPEAARGFVSADMRHHRAHGAQAELQALTLAQAALAQWFTELPEGWATMPSPGHLGEQSEAALTAVSEYYEAMGDRYGMETAYDLERHKALHFEQATELKDQHIANLEAALAHLGPLSEEQGERLEAAQERICELEAENQELSSRLERLTGEPKAAAANLLGMARKGRAKKAPSPS